MFKEDEGRFYRNINNSKLRRGKVPRIKKFVKFWEETRRKKKTPNRKRIVQIVGFSAPGIHGVTHFWNELTRIWTALMGSLKNRHSSKKKIQKWLTYRRTVLLPKGEEISNKGVYPPITGLNLSYKIYTGIV